jgi:hypothetical protein
MDFEPGHGNYFLEKQTESVAEFHKPLSTKRTSSCDRSFLRTRGLMSVSNDPRQSRSILQEKKKELHHFLLS